jgi:TetR/AcrR family transcriptional repressor of bet genes
MVRGCKNLYHFAIERRRKKIDYRLRESSFFMDRPQFTGRKASREFRREQLIDATITTLARRGLSQTTLSDVARTAGVSHGLLNFHFTTKERLLAEALSHLSMEHRETWEAALREAPAQPAPQLNALIMAEFSEKHFSHDKLSAWSAFWGEAQSRPLYLEQCGENDRAYIEVFERVCGDLVAEGGYTLDVSLAARVLRLTIEGVWLELTLSAKPYSLEEARATAYFCAATLFPRHFTPQGLALR